MPYAPEYGLYARTRQPLSRSHSRFTYLNWYFGRHGNRWYIICQAISRFRPRRWLPAADVTWVDRRVADVAAILGEIGLAAAPPASPPLAAMAATATAGALTAMWNRNVDVRFSNRMRYKVNFRPGTSSACSTTTRHFLAMIVSLRRRLPPGQPRQWACGRRRGFKATARLRYVTHHARGVLCTATMPEVRRFDRQNCQESPMK